MASDNGTSEQPNNTTPTWLEGFVELGQSLDQLIKAHLALAKSEWRLAKNAFKLALLAVILLLICLAGLALVILSLWIWLSTLWLGSLTWALVLCIGILSIGVLACLWVIRKSVHWMSLPRSRQALRNYRSGNHKQ